MDGSMKRMVAAAALAAALGFSGHSAAQAPTAADIKKAAEEFDLGKRAYKAGDYGEAAEHFVAADGSAPSAAALKAAIEARRKQGKLDRAATLAALVEQRHPDNAELVKLANEVLEEGRAELHELAVSCDLECDVVVNTRLVHGGKSEQRVVFLEPGSYTIRAGWTLGRTLSEDVTAEKGGSGEVSFEAPPEPEPEDEPEPTGPVTTGGGTMADTGPKEEPSGMPPAVFWTGVGLTAAVGGVTIWSGVDTVNNPGKGGVEEACAGQVYARASDCPAYSNAKDKEKRTNILIGVTSGVGAVTLLIGAFLTNWSGDGDDEAADAKKTRSADRSIEPYVTVGDGAVLGATGRF